MNMQTRESEREARKDALILPVNGSLDQGALTEMKKRPSFAITLSLFLFALCNTVNWLTKKVFAGKCKHSSLITSQWEYSPLSRERMVLVHSFFYYRCKKERKKEKVVTMHLSWPSPARPLAGRQRSWSKERVKKERGSVTKVLRQHDSQETERENKNLPAIHSIQVHCCRHIDISAVCPVSISFYLPLSLCGVHVFLLVSWHLSSPHSQATHVYIKPFVCLSVCLDVSLCSTFHVLSSGHCSYWWSHVLSLPVCILKLHPSSPVFIFMCCEWHNSLLSLSRLLCLLHSLVAHVCAIFCV